jgi:hypothetical protein
MLARTMKRIVLAALLLAASVAACVATQPDNVVVPAQPGAGPSDPPPPPPPAPAKLAAGAACDAADQCDSGTCEGEGCGAGQGVCAAADRACTRDLVAYCGCDGQTFRSSGSCPGQRFASRAACAPAAPPAPPAKQADGGACTTEADCESGICEGEGCGTAAGVCAPKSRKCTRDMATYCGCDGTEFKTSGSCPGRRFKNRGACAK